MSISSPNITVPTLTIYLDRLTANYRQLVACAAPARCAAVLKADAYGLGAREVAAVLLAEGCVDFFVATLDEALDLRAALGPHSRIFVLNGLPEGQERQAAEAGLTPVLNTLEQCRAWACIPRRPAVLQVDSGMSRLGLSLPDQQHLLESNLIAELNLVLIMSHLANADTPGHGSNVAQLDAFRAACRRFPHLSASLANSAGIFLGAEYHFYLCRPGAALYGLEIGPLARGIQPVVELHSPVTQIRAISSGTGIGYGHDFIAPHAMRLATIPVGYGDGWLRSLSGQGAVWQGQALLPIVGRVSMDSFIVDVSHLSDHALRVGDVVELIGPHQQVDDVARTAGTIGYEILTGFGRRFKRNYVGLREPGQ